MKRLRLYLMAAMTILNGGMMAASAAEYEVSSPNGKVKVMVTAEEAVRWSVTYDGKTVLMPSEIKISLQQAGKSLGLGKVGKVAKKQVKSSFENPFYRKSTVRDDYGQLRRKERDLLCYRE